MLRKRRSQGQRRQRRLFFMFFFSFFFFRQGHFPTQVFTCQEETQTSYGHRCGHIWSQYGVLRFMGIELRMWYYDTLDCTNIYIYVIQSAFLARRNLMRVSQIHQTNRRPSIHRVLLVSVLFASHTHIYIYVLDRCLGGNQHRKFAYL